jgi:hypothetical protein
MDGEGSGRKARRTYHFATPGKVSFYCQERRYQYRMMTGAQIDFIAYR